MKKMLLLTLIGLLFSCGSKEIKKLQGYEEFLQYLVQGTAEERNINCNFELYDDNVFFVLRDDYNKTTKCISAIVQFTNKIDELIQTRLNKDDFCLMCLREKKNKQEKKE